MEYVQRSVEALIQKDTSSLDVKHAVAIDLAVLECDLRKQEAATEGSPPWIQFDRAYLDPGHCTRISTALPLSVKDASRPTIPCLPHNPWLHQGLPPAAKARPAR